MNNPVYSQYRDRVANATRAYEFDKIIDAAYRDYIGYKLTDLEYGKIYFACIARSNNI